MSLVSVVMPLYNTEERYLRRAIESILKQTYTNFEFIIVCDKPTDGSEQIAEEYAAADNRIIVLKNEVNSGVAKTLNNGFRVAKGEYIARMDADDISPPKRLEKQVLYLSKHKEVDLVFLTSRYIDECGKIRLSCRRRLKNKHIVPTLFFSCQLCHPSVMLRRSVLPENEDVYDPHSKAEDYDLWTRLAVRGAVFAQIASPAFLYRIHSQQITQRNRTSIRSSGVKSLHKFVAACDILVTEEAIAKYFQMMRSYEAISKADYEEGNRVLHQILTCELLKKHDARCLIRRQKFLKVARLVGIRRSR